MKKILVTGGAGFIGRYTVKELQTFGHEVVVFDNFTPQIHNDRAKAIECAKSVSEVIVGDICNLAEITASLNGVSAVVHLAAETGVGQSMYEISRHASTNVVGTANLLEAIGNTTNEVESIVLASSRAIYGEGQYSCETCRQSVVPEPRETSALENGNWEPICPVCAGEVRPIPTKESSEKRPASVYAITKNTQEELVHCFCRSHGIRSIALRYFNVYGNGQSLSNPYTGILSTFASRLNSGKELLVYEDGQESRDFVHVADVALSNRIAIFGDVKNESYNVGSGMKLTIESLAESMSKAAKSNHGPVISGDFRVGDIRHCYADTNFSKTELGFESKMDFQKGIEDFIEWSASEDFVDHTEKAKQELTERGLLKTART